MSFPCFLLVCPRCVVESDSKQLLCQMPIVLVSVAPSAERARDAANTYDCPVYKYAERTDRHLLFSLPLPMRNKTSAKHWTLRGVALLCSNT